VAYNTSKGALVNFTRALATEWGEHGITVNAIAPGFFPSKMGDGLLEKLGTDKVVAQTPLGRIGDGDDLKGLALLLESSAGKHITGQIIPVDGGMSCAMG
jgi:gluconate 5-dehydrogenase